VLEDLMTLVSELVLTRNQILQLARNQDSAAFSVPLQRLSHITTDLQEGVMKTRMQPIGNAWAKLPRLVRDLTVELDKRIELVMHGAETELDRQVLELIKDPLTHMVRNSADHGLETAAERRAAGKSESGHIILNAYHEGGHIIIEIRDDGRGLPVDKIRAKALAKGMVTESELSAMTDNQILRFIFRPGFSTAAAVTAVSGRGVGMDVVKTNVERIGGTIELESAEGRGTTFTIKIPLTLAIVSALIVEAGAERFAIPQLSVIELVRAGTKLSADQDDSEPIVQMIDHTPVLRLRNRLLPLVNLNELLNLGSGDPAGTDVDTRRHIVVAQVGASLLGIVVDRVFDTEEIVVKPVAPIMRHVTMFSGNTILGDGSVIMILDPNGIARATGIAGAVDGRRRDEIASQAHVATNGRTAMLLFRAGSAEPKGVPLGLVARLEEIDTTAIEGSADDPVTQYRGRLMPLVAMAGSLDLTKMRQSVLVFSDAERRLGHDRCMGLVVDEIIDVVEDAMSIQLAAERPGILGRAVIGGKATEIIDTGYWLTRAFADWFESADRGSRVEHQRLLVVDDSSFFRQLLEPALVAAGYVVTSVASAAEALALAETGVMFDAILSDIEMPNMDGVAFVTRLRASGAWSKLPIIAHTALATPAQIEAGRAAGFTDYVRKFERDALLTSLRQCIAASADSQLLA
jgi:two-component system chemotaxis sensor kinase CheA